MDQRVQKATVVLWVLGSLGFSYWFLEFIAKRKNSQSILSEDSIREQVEKDEHQRKDDTVSGPSSMVLLHSSSDTNEGMESTSSINPVSDTPLLTSESGTSWKDINSGKQHTTHVTEACGPNKEEMMQMLLFSDSGVKMQLWSDLPVDLINFIVVRLDYIEQIRCRAVCKSWRSNICGIKYPDKLPWVIAFIGKKKDAITTSICHLFDPSQKRKHAIENKGKEWEIFAGADVLASKQSWVLLSKTRNMSTALFFYNPFTNKFMKLPELQVELSPTDRATFSTTPDSSDCVTYVSSARCKGVRLYTCRLGDKTWTGLYIQSSLRHSNQLAYVEGVLYFAFYGVMGTFRIAQREWKIHPYPVATKDTGFFLVESHDGKLLVLTGIGASSHVFVFDNLSERNWFELESLTDRSLFLGFPTSISIPAVGETSEVANTIHFCGMISFNFLKECKDKLRQQYFDWIMEEKEHHNTYWIQTPQIR